MALGLFTGGFLAILPVGYAKPILLGINRQLAAIGPRLHGNVWVTDTMDRPEYAKLTNQRAL